MKGPQGFANFMNVVMNLLLGFLVSAAVQLFAAGAIDGPSLASATLMSLVVGFMLGTLAPIMGWGYALAGKMNLKPGSVGEYIVVALTLGICMGVGICCGCSLINNIPLGAGAVLGFITGFCPFICCVACVCVLIFLKPVMTLGIKASGFNPAAAPQEAA